ncbi:hypothetical protein V1511DRAFT_504420, partial [Dipodascopsis uninucleata]
MELSSVVGRDSPKSAEETMSDSTESIPLPEKTTVKSQSPEHESSLSIAPKREITSLSSISDVGIKTEPSESQSLLISESVSSTGTKTKPAHPLRTESDIESDHRIKIRKTSHASSENDNSSSATPTDSTSYSKNRQRGGAPTRQYLNDTVTPALLEGVKLIAREQPDNPLEVLGRFLLEQSKNTGSS